MAMENEKNKNCTKVNGPQEKKNTHTHTILKKITSIQGFFFVSPNIVM
jgi:hypothetical protein